MYSLDRERTRAAAHMARLGRDAELTGAERAALARLEEALDAARATAAPCATLLADLIEAAARLEALVERRYTIEDWREVARVDADSILEERRLWAETQLHGPLAPTR